jgi:hypothetical protein
LTEISAIVSRVKNFIDFTKFMLLCILITNKSIL